MNTSERVLTLEVIPPSLRDLPQWVLWRYETRDGKPTKCPYCVDGYRARSNDPATWATAAAVLEAMCTGKPVGYVGARSKSRPEEPPGPADGIGVMFGETVYGVDVDHARDPETGGLSPECRDILDTLNSYAEVSPSGAGVHVLLFADELPGRARRRDKVEVYGPGSPRFFTFTGERIDGYPEDLAHRQAELEAVHARYVAKPAPLLRAAPARVAPSGAHRPQEAMREPAGVWDDAEILRRAESGRYGAEFSALWRGNLTCVNGDHSRGDYTVCRELLYWSGGDTATADRLFRQSALYREKWDERRGAETYGARTLANALASLTHVWDPRRGNRRKLRLAEAQADGEPEAALLPGTDLALAQRFVDTYGDGLRYVPERAAWHLWDGRRWAEDATGAAVWGLLRAQGRELGHEAAAAHDSRDARREARRACSVHGMEATERLARYDPAVLTHADTLDADPWLLNCQNGTLDLRTGKLRAHDPADLLTALVPTDYVPDTPCPRFEAFLAESIPDPDTRGFVQRLLGYGLTGETRERVFALGVGPTASGKSTLAAVLRGVLGSDYTRPISADALVRTHLEDLRVAGEFERGRIQIGSEVPREGQWRTALLKSVTGGTDLVACRPLYSETRQFRPGGLVLLFANHYPQADAEDGAFWERCRVVTFGETCPQERRDPSLDAALLEERVGILAWLVRGCLEWQRDGLRTSAAVADAGERYRLSEDVTGRFLEDRVIWDPSATLPAKDLYAAFVAWCEAEGESPCTQTRLGLDLAARGFEQKRTNAARIWRGLRLRADRRGPYRPDSTPTTHSATQRESIHNASGENSDGCDGCDAIPIKSLRVTRDKNDSYLENVQGFCENPSNASHPSLCLSHIATADAGSAGGRSGNHLPVAAASDAPSPVPEEYAAASVPHTVNRRGVAADEQERDIARGLRAEDEFAALLEAAGIDFERTPKHVTEPDGGADFILSSGVGVDVKTTTMPGRAVVCEEQMPHLPEWLAFCHTHGEEERFLGVIRSADFMAAAKLVGRDGSIPGPMRASGEPYRAHYPLRVLADDRLGHLRPIDALREDV